MDRRASDQRPRPSFKLTLHSFGFKTGAERVIRNRRNQPLDLSIIYDVRHLPAVDRVSELKRLTGLDELVVHKIQNHEMISLARRKAQEFCVDLLMWFRAGKPWINVGVGSKYGRHRSVVFVELLAQYLKEEFSDHGQSISINIRHWTLESSNLRREHQVHGHIREIPGAPGQGVRLVADPVALQRACCEG